MKVNRIYQIVAIIVIVVLSSVILFIPNPIGQKYPWTYQNIQDKKKELISVSETLSDNERKIQSLKQNLQDLKKREKDSAEDVSQLKKGMKDYDLQIDIPSFLITLEQKAYETGVDLLIGYNSLITTKGSSSTQDPTLDENGSPAESSTEGGVVDEKGEQGTPQENKASEKTTEGIEVNESTTKENSTSETTTKGTEVNESTTKENGTSETTTKGTEANDSTANTEDSKDGENKEEDKGPKIDNNVKIPTIDSIDVTTIPIEVKGTFFKVRDYLKFLDELGLIEPSSVKMTTDGMEVTAEITLNIFHWKGVE